MVGDPKRQHSMEVVGGIIGGGIGLFLAIVPLYVLMELSYERTGYDAGNAGVFFCCTVPTFPIIGAFIGVWLAHIFGKPDE